MNATQKKQARPTTAKKGGSTLTKQMSDLAVPFGLILAKQSLQSFLQADKEAKTTSSKKSAKSAAKRVSLSGGASCGASKASADKVAGYEKFKPGAAVGGYKLKNYNKAHPTHEAKKAKLRVSAKK